MPDPIPRVLKQKKASFAIAIVNWIMLLLSPVWILLLIFHLLVCEWESTGKPILTGRQRMWRDE